MMNDNPVHCTEWNWEGRGGEGSRVEVLNINCRGRVMMNDNPVHCTEWNW